MHLEPIGWKISAWKHIIIAMGKTIIEKQMNLVLS